MNFRRKFTIALLIVLLMPALARAEKRKIISYSLETIYSTAIRLLRIDLNYEIIEKDKEGGYIIFNYVDTTTGKKSRGSLELLPKESDKANLVQAVCNIPDVPGYVELDLLEKLNLKLNNDHRQ